MEQGGACPKMTGKLAGKVALITGGGRGIGRAIAVTFAHEGAHVAVAARTKAEVDRVAEEIQSDGGEALALTCDVTKREEVDRMVSNTLARFGRIDVLVNNAGTAKSAPLVKCTDELWNQIIGVNLTSTFLCTRAVIPGMIERGWGRVINIASTAAKVGGAYISAYSAAKHGVLGFTRSVAYEVATKGVTVNAICPGYVDTDLTRETIINIIKKTGRDEAFALEFLASTSPQKRLIVPDEVANIAVFLASDASFGINGQSVNICGGVVMS